MLDVGFSVLLTVNYGGLLFINLFAHNYVAVALEREYLHCKQYNTK